MSTTKPKSGQGTVETAVDEINAKLKEAYEDKARGDYAPLESLDVLLSEARDRAKATR